MMEIPRRSRHCSEGGEEFTQGSAYVSLLKIGSKGEPLRSDYCLTCWEQVRELQEGGILWRSQVPVKEEVLNPLVRREDQVLQQLRERHQSQNQEELGEAFILAQLLARSRLLQLKQEMNREGEKGFLFEVRGTEEMLFVKKVAISAAQIDRMKALWTTS